MDNNYGVVTLNEFLNKNPEDIFVPIDCDREILVEFADLTNSALEQFEKVMLAYEADRKQDFITSARRIIHNIKGEAGMLSIAEISNVCHLAESLLYGDCGEVPVDTMLFFKDWLTKAVEHFCKVRENNLD